MIVLKYKVSGRETVLENTLDTFIIIHHMFIMSSYFRESFHVFSPSHRMFMTFQIHFMAKNHHSSPFITIHRFILDSFDQAPGAIRSVAYRDCFCCVWILCPPLQIYSFCPNSTSITSIGFDCSIVRFGATMIFSERLQDCFFQKVLCFATPMERNIDSRTSTLALASQQFPRFVG